MSATLCHAIVMHVRLVSVEPEQTASPESWAVIHGPVKQQSVQDSFQGVAGTRIPVRQQHIQAGVHGLREEVAGVPRCLQRRKTVHHREHLSRRRPQVIRSICMTHSPKCGVEFDGSTAETGARLKPDGALLMGCCVPWSQ